MSLYVDIEKELPSFKLKVKIDQKEGILGFLGESGSGKSMTLRCIAGLEKPSRGKIILNDRVLFDSEKKIDIPTRDRNVGFLFQNYALFPHMTVWENIELGLEGTEKQEKRKISEHYLGIVGLQGMGSRYPWQLSGGQQQRVALSRVLATSPDILLLDEPFSALDHHLRSNMEKELLNLIEDFSGDILFVTHDIEEAYRVCDDIIVYDRGNGINKRNKKDLFLKPNTYSEAKITGCKNISKAKRLDDYTIFAEDWDIELKVDEVVDKDIEYIGIREHDIKIGTSIRNISSLNINSMNLDEGLRESTNRFEFKLLNIVENPFSYYLFIYNNNSKEALEIERDIKNESNYVKLLDQNKLIQVEVDKLTFKKEKNDSVYIYLPKEKLFCI